jgi:regulator of replication initiation timing
MKIMETLDMTSEFIELDTVIHFKGEQMNDTRRHLHKLENQLETLTRQYDELEDQVNNLIDTNIELRKERDQLRRRIKELEAR